MGPIVIMVICALLVFLGWRAPRYRSLATGATGVLIFLASALAWRYLVHSEAIPLDRLLGRHWFFATGVFTELLVFFGPPAVATALVFLLFGKSLTPPAGDDD
jgi:Na+/citrate or Na+/malate symporter